MKPLSYQFVVVRDEDFPVLGTLRDWATGNEAALRHLEKQYPGWTRITIQKISEPAAKPSRQGRNLRSLRKSNYCNQGVRDFA